MINLKQDPLIGDEILLAYEGPGYYSAKSSKPVSDGLTLVKIAEEYMDKEDVYQFCKQNNYSVKPYKIDCCSDVPDHWEITGCSGVDEIEYEDNY